MICYSIRPLKILPDTDERRRYKIHCSVQEMTERTPRPTVERLVAIENRLRLGLPRNL